MTDDDAVWRQLAGGHAALYELPPLLFATYCLAYDDGRASRDPEVEALRAELERVALHAFDPGRQRRIVDELLERDRVQRHRRGGVA